MSRTAWIWVGIVLAFVAAGAVVSIFQSHNTVGGPILAVIFGAAAWRCWHLAGQDD